MKLLAFGLLRLDRDAVALRSAWPSTASVLLLVEHILRVEAEFLGVAVFPGGRAQIAERDLAFAGIELGDLAELQLVAFAGIAGKIVEDAAAHRLDAAARRATWTA